MKGNKQPCLWYTSLTIRQDFYRVKIANMRVSIIYIILNSDLYILILIVSVHQSRFKKGDIVRLINISNYNHLEWTLDYLNSLTNRQLESLLTQLINEGAIHGDIIYGKTFTLFLETILVGDGVLKAKFLNPNFVPNFTDREGVAFNIWKKIVNKHNTASKV